MGKIIKRVMRLCKGMAGAARMHPHVRGGAAAVGLRSTAEEVTVLGAIDVTGEELWSSTEGCTRVCQISYVPGAGWVGVGRFKQWQLQGHLAFLLLRCGRRDCECIGWVLVSDEDRLRAWQGGVCSRVVHEEQ